MRTKLVLGVVLLLMIGVPASADFTLVRTIPSPSVHVTGLDDADGVLFGVIGYDGEESCLFLADPADGDVLDIECLDTAPPGCPEMPPHYVSCAFLPRNSLALDPDVPLGLDTYCVGDACGDIIKYNWTETHGLVYAGHCRPEGMGEPAGLTVRDHVYVLDSTNRSVFKLNVCFDAPHHICYLPDDIGNPSALATYGSNFFVSDAGTDLVYEIHPWCGLVEVHSLQGFGPRTLAGMTFIGDELFVASDNDEIMVYRFGSHGWEVPEGDSVVVVPLPDELEITFPSVTVPGSLYVHVSETDSCPAPVGVRLLPSFYEITTTASFDYVAQVAILAEDPMPENVNSDLVRIFRRPSGDCMPFMDVTVAPVEFVENLRDPRLARLSKRLSEDDEFSVFILGEDRRPPMDVINLKYNYLQEAIDAIGGVPIDPQNLMNALKAKAMAATSARRFARAAALVDRIADVATATPEIPHTYDPDIPGANLGGAIVARAHTLSFSLRQLVEERILVGPALAMAPKVSGIALSPNPSSSSFTITFAPEGSAPVGLKIYSVDGRVVRTLLDNASPGYRTLIWDSLNDAGLPVAAGTYFAVLTQGRRVSVEKLILQK
jgi:hypothetical protein